VYIERMQEGAVTVSADGLILYCNHRFAEMLGRPLEKVISSTIRDHLSAEAWAHLGTIFTGGEDVVKYEAVLQPRRGAPLPVNLTASHLQLDGPGMMCLVVTDLTEQKEQAAMRLAKEVAEKANLAKDDFLAALSHELRTPLTPALMTATALEQDATLPEKIRADIALIRRNVELEARLIDDLLDLTLITHGKLSLQHGEVDLHACLHRAVEIVATDAQAKGIALKIDCAARHAQFSGDPVRVQQVCWNVLRNAVKFTPPRGSIAIATGNDESHGVWVRITDTGIGFTPEQAGRIFEAFEQGGRDITRQFGGLGLGLAITRSIMGAHGGHIEAESSGLDRGATFVLRFPLTTATRPAVRPAAPAAGNTRRLDILLVEDHKDTRLTIQRLLETSHHRVTAASDAQSALALAAKAQFDLVISDLGLPDLTGHELMRLLRQRFSLSGIALSGYGMENDLEQSRAAGFRFHLTKPVSFDQLRKSVAEFAHPAASAPAVAGTLP
jgi:PAS domain S-box-containing protein